MYFDELYEQFRRDKIMPMMPRAFMDDITTPVTAATPCDHIRDTVVFKVPERIMDFIPENDPPDSEKIFGGLLPYDNMCIALNDAVIWVTTTHDEERNIHTLTFRGYWRISPKVMQGADSPIKCCTIHYFLEKRDNVYMLRPMEGMLTDKGEPAYVGTRIIPTYQVHPQVAIDYLNAHPEVIEGFSAGIMSLIWRFINLVSCKNVRTTKATIDAKLQKKRAKKGKPPLWDYYVLEIQNSTSAGGEAPQHLWTNRYHMCRGHVKHYTADAPLFGRIVGNIWVPAHARGNKKKGIIVKDYKVTTEAQPNA